MGDIAKKSVGGADCCSGLTRNRIRSVGLIFSLEIFLSIDLGIAPFIVSEKLSRMWLDPQPDTFCRLDLFFRNFSFD